MAVTRSIHLATEIPGPRSREIIARKELSVASPLSLYLPIVAAEGHGAMLTDVDGNTFIDFAGGVGCLNVGHAHPNVVEAVQEQAARFFHTDFTIVPYEVYVTLAERLLALAPFRGPAKAAFFNAGTEAVENSVKFARAYTGRPAVIAFEGAFHGRTLLSLTLTSKTHPYKAGLGPFAPEVYRVPFPNEYRGVTTADALDALERALVTQVAPETVAAIVLEPVQGEGGFIVAPQAFMEGVRALCDRHGIVMVVDEVQTGFGRTGKMFAIEHYGIEPDLLIVAKSIAAGLPLSGVLGKAAIMDAPGESAVGGTYVGNPDRAGGGARRPRRLRGRAARGACRPHRRGHSRQDARMAGAFSADRRRPWPRRDAGRGVRPRPGDEGAGAGAGVAGRGGGGRARAAAAQGRHPLELQPRALPAGDHGRRARRGARRLGGGARSLDGLGLVGELIADRYELGELVGTGGMSSVYRAHDRQLERNVALKVLHERLGADDEHVSRFRHEARAVAQLSHPNVVTVIDRFEEDGRQYIVFEYVDGENLKQLLDRHRAAAGAAARSRSRLRSRTGSRTRTSTASCTAT